MFLFPFFHREKRLFFRCCTLLQKCHASWKELNTNEWDAITFCKCSSTFYNLMEISIHWLQLHFFFTIEAQDLFVCFACRMENQRENENRAKSKAKRKTLCIALFLYRHLIMSTHNYMQNGNTASVCVCMLFTTIQL